MTDAEVCYFTTRISVGDDKEYQGLSRLNVGQLQQRNRYCFSKKDYEKAVQDAHAAAFETFLDHLKSVLDAERNRQEQMT